ncbi:2-keto-4-pentenoate hydratase [Sphingomonas sp. BIUV-7]|uniref:2-keto-4-pentenoate hydratase n=1 Tax=Sphingomonas natans TaxID=3063330 RepID=A0ABT8Y611_9SPHN|nr:2-keto-4-pentenoate hydratase [Sphingomonas sp. BIUV-7]MDO6413353.1 2-keto-4-pentenoate hydratase [Sphingomonas sp. BIUV-7]
MTSDTGSQNLSQIAHAFVTARKSRTALLTYPGTIPASIAEAYEVQDQAIALYGDEVGGWKVGRINPPVDGVNRLAGPIFTDVIFDETPAPIAMPVFGEGFAAAEAEFLLRIGTAPDPAKTSYTIEEAATLLDAVHIGIEIASSPYPGINADGPLVTISDFGNNNGLVIGAEIPNWRDRDLNAWIVELDINGEPIGSKTAAEMLDGPIGAARFLFEVMAKRGIALTPGQWISSGAVTGVHPVAVGDAVEVRFDRRLVTSCTITAL